MLVNENQFEVLDSVDDFDFIEMEKTLSQELEENFSALEFLKDEREDIDNPDKLGEVILDEIWNQFGNQIGLDMTSETLIQQYDREHPESYKEVGATVMQDSKYIKANKEMKQKQESGNLRDEYTGKNLSPTEKSNLDHVVPRKEIFENQRRKQAGLSVADLANKDENLQATNESLNKSKGAKSNKEYVDPEKRKQRESDLKEQNKKANEKIDNSNLSDAEKKERKAKNDKRLNDKLAADEKLMLEKDRQARKAINSDIRKQATINVTKKAGKDALKTVAVSALFSLLKEIMNSFVEFLKEKNKSFHGFLEKMKKAISSFFLNLKNLLSQGTSSFVGTIISEIFGPIVSMFKKFSSLIKQGILGIKEVFSYIKNNKEKPFAIKIAEIGKIVTGILAGGGALLLGETIEKALMTIPFMNMSIPLIGTLANVIGLFLASLVSGLIGAIVINRINKFIAKKLKNQKTQEIIDKKIKY